MNIGELLKQASQDRQQQTGKGNDRQRSFSRPSSAAYGGGGGAGANRVQQKKEEEQKNARYLMDKAVAGIVKGEDFTSVHPLLSRALSLYSTVYGKDHPQTLQLMQTLVCFYLFHHKINLALPTLGRLLSSLQRLPDKSTNPDDIFSVSVCLASVLAQTGQYEDSLRVLDIAQQVENDGLPAEEQKARACMLALRVAFVQGSMQQADKCMENLEYSVEIAQTLQTSKNYWLCTALLELATFVAPTDATRAGILFERVIKLAEGMQSIMEGETKEEKKEEKVSPLSVVSDFAPTPELWLARALGSRAVLGCQITSNSGKKVESSGGRSTTERIAECKKALSVYRKASTTESLTLLSLSKPSTPSSSSSASEPVESPLVSPLPSLLSSLLASPALILFLSPVLLYPIDTSLTPRSGNGTGKGSRPGSSLSHRSSENSSPTASSPSRPTSARYSSRPWSSCGWSTAREDGTEEKQQTNNDSSISTSFVWYRIGCGLHFNMGFLFLQQQNSKAAKQLTKALSMMRGSWHYPPNHPVLLALNKELTFLTSSFSLSDLSHSASSVSLDSAPPSSARTANARVSPRSPKYSDFGTPSGAAGTTRRPATPLLQPLHTHHNFNPAAPFSHSPTPPAHPSGLPFSTPNNNGLGPRERLKMRRRQESSTPTPEPV